MNNTDHVSQNIVNEIKSNDVVLFMKGTPVFPMCGFSAATVEVLNKIGVKFESVNVLDSDEMVAEKSETDNQIIADDTMTVGNGVNACATPQDDASTGADIGDDVTTSTDLGLDVEAEIRGCVDSNDEADLYKVSVSPNQPLEVTLVVAPFDGVDFDLEIQA